MIVSFIMELKFSIHSGIGFINQWLLEMVYMRKPFRFRKYEVWQIKRFKIRKTTEAEFFLYILAHPCMNIAIFWRKPFVSFFVLILHAPSLWLATFIAHINNLILITIACKRPLRFLYSRLYTAFDCINWKLWSPTYG